MKPTRPLMRYFGGKWRLAPWIISFFPRHNVYCEPYGGAASVLLRKSRVNDEIYNDVDHDVVTLFRVLRDADQSKRLIELCTLTPYSREEFSAMATSESTDPVDRAHRLVFMSAAGFSSNTATRKTGHVMRSFRRGYRNYQCAAMDWAKYPDALLEVVNRLRGVLIESKSAIDCIRFYDTPDTLFYVDPPYPHGTRGTDNDYRHEMTDEDHVALSYALKRCVGKIVVSGYRCDLYDYLYRNWRRHDTLSRGQSNRGTKMNTESIWLSPNMDHRQLFLDDGEIDYATHVESK